MSTPLVDLHKTLCDLWRELGETDQTSSECWQDIAIALQFSAVPGLQQLGIELQGSLSRDISGKLFSSGAELQAIHTYIFTAIGAAFSGEKYPAAALSAVNSLRVNAQQNLSSANQWSAAVDVDNVAGLDEDVRARLNVWLAKATQLFKLALMQLLKGQPDGLVALQKLLPRLVSATSACASHPLWVKAAAFVAALASHQSTADEGPRVNVLGDHRLSTACMAGGVRATTPPWLRPGVSGQFCRLVSSFRSAAGGW